MRWYCDSQKAGTRSLSGQATLPLVASALRQLDPTAELCGIGLSAAPTIAQQREEYAKVQIRDVNNGMFEIALDEVVDVIGDALSGLHVTTAIEGDDPDAAVKVCLVGQEAYRFLDEYMRYLAMIEGSIVPMPTNDDDYACYRRDLIARC